MSHSDLTRKQPVIWVDADACPVAIREIVFKAARRLQLQTTLIANGQLRIPKSEFINQVIVPHGADVADNRIVEQMKPGDLVITQDIPLAAMVVAKGGTAIGPRGQLYDDDSVHERLATRDLMEELRSAGVETGGPKPFDKKDVQAFANQLDRTLNRLLK